jgi:hypothetical protein
MAPIAAETINLIPEASVLVYCGSASSVATGVLREP